MRSGWPGAGTRLRSLFLPGLLIQHERTRQESCDSKSGLWTSVVIGRLERDGDLWGRWTASKKGSDTVTPATTSTGKIPGVADTSIEVESRRLDKVSCEGCAARQI